MKGKIIGILVATLLIITSTLSVVGSTYVDRIESSNVTIPKSSLPVEPDLVMGNITSGLLRVSVEITNVGDAEAMDVEWSIGITEGMFVLLSGSKTGVINSVPSGGIEVISSDIMLGFGPVDIDAIAEISDDLAERHAEGFLVGPILFQKKDFIPPEIRFNWYEKNKTVKLTFRGWHYAVSLIDCKLNKGNTLVGAFAPHGGPYPACDSVKPGDNPKEFVKYIPCEQKPDNALFHYQSKVKGKKDDVEIQRATGAKTKNVKNIVWGKFSDLF